jgi:hypothetical protein
MEEAKSIMLETGGTGGMVRAYGPMFGRYRSETFLFIRRAMMLKRTLICALTVVLATLFSGSAFAALDHDSTPWDFVADFSTNGDFPDGAATVGADGTQYDGWQYYDGVDFGNSSPEDIPGGSANPTGNAKWLMSGGIGTENPLANGYGFFNINPNYTPNSGFTVEWRMKVLTANNGADDKISMQVTTAEVSDRAYGWIITYSDQPDLGNGQNQVIAERGGEVFALDTRSDFVTYRLVLDPQNIPAGVAPGTWMTAEAQLYADGVLLGDVTGPLLSGSNRSDFGRLSGSNYAGVIGADWDYVQLHTGGTAAIPEPASIALIGLGALMMIKRRR